MLIGKGATLKVSYQDGPTIQGLLDAIEQMPARQPETQQQS